MSKEELKRVSDTKTAKLVKKGETIFGEGEKLNGVYCVRDGVSKLSKLSPNGKDQIVKLATKGALLGQRSVITEEVANLSAIAVNDMQVCFVPKDAIIDSLNNNPNFAVEVLRHIAHDLKEADDVIVNMSQKTVRQRIAEAFIYLEENFGTDRNGYLALTLSREDIANVVGTATESAIRIISNFKKLGLIKTNGKKVAIADRKALYDVVKGC
ncbi:MULTISPECIES: Crp/Fnr family transcriptional regulator [unclassified Arenibacter]|uniref:Crp/Fnr family transcriptional regulator n=1 Tax=unclassified Arenibacter TaxID=2615047 RepID=UPI000E34723A|nr:MULTISPECIES: Crp/Fnr family transcriptional regulator [unclassified Arenibacter]MCM4162566.1 Crp/Fnr family transcriptional regulator [Arenibacter sp. A80]RFT58143.1 Crp/Fnr family transcriptional regulator [Arenibacter sp. P308M17]